MKKVRNVMELNPKEFKYVLTICLFLNAIICLGQGGVYINYDINPKTYDIEEPLNLWISFLETKSD